MRGRGTRARPPSVTKVDDEWLHALQKATFTYFWHGTNPENGLIPDNTLTQRSHASVNGLD
jgi:hypothetical protein